MNTASHHSRMMVLWVLGAAMLAATLALCTAGAAWAQPPVTDTQVERFTETFDSELDFLCGQGGVYHIVATVHVVEHVTSFENGALHYQFKIHGSAVSVPLDGTGPTYTAHFRSSDSENIRNVKRGDVLVETDTDHYKVVAKGSDGSRAFLSAHHHFTVNANGETTVEFEMGRASC